MSEPADRDVSAEFEALLATALRPIDPPETLSNRFEETLASVSETAATELSNWADELSESELESLRDPRNWVRPVVAVAAGGVATGALVLLGAAPPQAKRPRRAGASRACASRPGLARIQRQARLRSARRPRASPARRRCPTTPRIRCRKLSSVLIGTRSIRTPTPFSVSRKPQSASTR